MSRAGVSHMYVWPHLQEKARQGLNLNLQQHGWLLAVVLFLFSPSMTFDGRKPIFFFSHNTTNLPFAFATTVLNLAANAFSNNLATSRTAFRPYPTPKPRPNARHAATSCPTSGDLAMTTGGLLPVMIVIAFRPEVGCGRPLFVLSYPFLLRFVHQFRFLSFLDLISCL